MNIDLRFGDCVEIMPTFPVQSVDAILTDIPYGTTACKWDTVIPFPDLWRVVKHVLKPKGVFVTTASQPFTSALVMSNPKWFSDELIWEKSKAIGFLDANRKPLNSHENIIIFSHGRYTYNPQKWIVSERFIDRRNKLTIENYNQNIYGKHTKTEHRKDDGSRYPLSIVSIESINTEKTGHPTQKPVALYEYLIRTYTNEGDTVLDMCMGSGTTGVACKNLNRNFIGIEKDEKYFEIAKNRINQA